MEKKLTKDTLIEGKVLPKDTTIIISESVKKTDKKPLLENSDVENYLRSELVGQGKIWDIVQAYDKAKSSKYGLYNTDPDDLIRSPNVKNILSNALRMASGTTTYSDIFRMAYEIVKGQAKGYWESNESKKEKLEEKLTTTTIEQNLANIIVKDLAYETDILQEIIDVTGAYTELSDSILDLETKVSDRYYQVYQNFWDTIDNDFVNNATGNDIPERIIDETLKSLGYR